MLGKLTGFEIRYHTRQIGFWITIVIMFLLGFMIMSTEWFNISSGTGERIKINGAATLALQTSVFSLFSIFFGAIFVVSGVMRDTVFKALEIVHSTPVSTRDMTLSRMFGVYVATFLCISAGVAGLFVGQFAPWIDQETLGPVNILYFLQPSLVYTAVNTLLISALFTTVAALTRDRALVYVSAVALFILYTSSGFFVGQDAPEWLTALVDPFGSSALALTTEFWPAAEQNTRMSPLGGLIGMNRLVWGGVGLVLYLATFNLFRRGLVSGKSKKSIVDTDPQTGRIVLHAAATQQTASSAVKAFMARFKYEYFTTVRSIPFIILSLLAVVLFGLAVYAQMKFVPNPVLPTSIQMATLVIGSLLIPTLIIMVFFSGEMIWRDKVHGMTEILDATPVLNWPLLAGKWLALIGVVYTLLTLGMVFGIITQMVLGDIPVHLSTYMTYAYISFAPRLVMFSLLVLFVQNFMPNRVVGMLAAGAFVIFFFFFAGALPFSHPLIQFGNISTGAYSEMSGFASLARFRWFGLYWGSLGALFVVLSIWLWRRGLQSSLLVRLKTLGKRLSLPSVAVAMVFLASFAGAGAFIYKAYNIDNDFLTNKQREKRQVAWEKLLGRHLKDDLPKIRSVEADITFNPSMRTATVKGRYSVENTTGKPLREVYISMPRRLDADNRSLNLVGAKQVTEGDNIPKFKAFATRVYRFDPPLAPGATTTMTFETFVRASTLGDREPILRNGTFINNTVVMPQFGVVDRRMRNPDKRRKYDLPEREKRADRTDMAARQNNFFGKSADYVDFKAKVCTDIGQIPITPGKLMREYEENGKACRDYQAVRPIANFFSFLSADFTEKRSVWENPNGENVDLVIYYHKSHGYNVDLMMKAMKNALDTYTKTFGPYLYSQIRILEFPNAGFAQSFAGTIPFSENIGFVMDPGDPDDNEKVDLATYVVMHEIGHQWFGHQIMPANTKGFNVLSEGLTENAAMTAYENALGWQKARRVLEQRSIRSYLASRTVDRDKEPPLAKAEGQQYLDYNKASWVFWGLKQYMGKDKMQGAVRSFLQEYGYKGPPYPTTRELVAALRAAAGPKWQQLITDYWDRITFWDLKFGDDISVKPNADGGFTVSFTAIVDKKIASEKDGKETSVTKIEGESLDEWIEIGFYDKNPKKTLGDKWLKLERVHITDPKTPLTFNLDKRPEFILLDPRRLLMERNVKDNEKTLEKGKLASNN
jgi:ABC-2 type transport system permease protein